MKRLIRIAISGTMVAAASLVASPPLVEAASSCSATWTVDSVPQIGAGSDTLFAAAAISASDVWVAGSALNPARSAWTPIPTPNPRRPEYFRGVSGSSSDDVWAVGVGTGALGEDVTYVNHWDGSSWSIVPSSNPGEEGFLRSVTALSPTDAWAVGFGSEPSSNFHAWSVHWDGTQWLHVATPFPARSSISELDGVAAVSSTDVWAVGHVTIDAAHVRTLIEHGDGSSWSMVPSPNRPGVTNQLTAVAAVAADDAWAVSYSGPANSVGRTLVEHWDGTSWTIVPSPSTGSDQLLSVAAVTATNVWAVGWRGTFPEERTLIEHWDGSSWHVVPSPNPSSQDDALQGITALPTGELWAAGQAKRNGVSIPLVESACVP